MKPALLKPPHPQPTPAAGGSELDGFLPETPPTVATAAPAKRRSSRTLQLGGVLIAAAALLGAGVWWSGVSRLGAPSTGSLRVESEPAGADVSIDGATRGKTPLTVSLNPGAHQVVVQSGGKTQQVPVTIEAGTSLVHHIAWTTDASAAPSAAGSLRVVTEPASAARVTVDGIDRGTAPLTIVDLAPGDHDVVVRDRSGTRRRSVTVERGVMASLVFSAAAPAGVASGWLSVPTSTPLQIFEGGKLVGSTESDRIMLPVGDHTFEIVSQALGYRATQDVRIMAGQTATVTLRLPQAPMSVNAAPWAQVWIDGQPVGETPIGNVMQTIGPHQLVFRHPQLGERRVTATVTLNEPTRVAVDMRK